MIPKRFELLGRTVTVKKTKKKTFFDVDTYGHWDGSTFEIFLAEDLTEQQEQQTFWHEWAHAALDSLGYNDLSSNEQLVDLLGSLIQQTMKTMR